VLREQGVAELLEAFVAALEGAERGGELVASESEVWLVRVDGCPDALCQRSLAHLAQEKRQFGDGDIRHLDVGNLHAADIPVCLRGKHLLVVVVRGRQEPLPEGFERIDRVRRYAARIS
jgi:hypothetical protein